jgi:hypothetical protein
MNLQKLITTALIATSFLFGFHSLCLAKEYKWEFKDRRDFIGWGKQQNMSLYIEKDHLVVKGRGYPRLLSPFAVNIPSSAEMVWLRLKTSRSGRSTILLDSAKDKISYSKDFTLKAGSGYRDYKVHIGDVFPQDDIIVWFAFDFPILEFTDEISIDFIRFYEPTFLQILSLWWSKFWEPEKITLKTINSVTTPRIGFFSFMSVLYAVVIILSVGIVLHFFALKAFTWESVLRAISISFLVGGGLFAVRMDYNWLKIWQDDFTAFRDKDVHERIPVVFKSDFKRSFWSFEFFNFIDFVKATVPEGEKVRPAAKPFRNPLAATARYYLLPIRTSESADYLWVYRDKDVSFDEVNGSLKKGNKIIASPVRPFAKFNSMAAVYKILKEEER